MSLPIQELEAQLACSTADYCSKQSPKSIIRSLFTQVTPFLFKTLIQTNDVTKLYTTHVVNDVIVIINLPLHFEKCKKLFLECILILSK